VPKQTLLVVALRVPLSARRQRQVKALYRVHEVSAAGNGGCGLGHDVSDSEYVNGLKCADVD